MSASGATHRTYSFGEFTLDLDRGALLSAGTDIKLRPKTFEVLCYLVERQGLLVTKDDLLDAIWGHTVVTDNAVTHCVTDIRRALQDQSQEMLRTIPRRGYIFDVPVTQHGGSTALSDTPSRTLFGSRWPRWGLVAALVLVLGVTTIWWGLGNRTVEVPATTTRYSIAVLPFVNLSDSTVDEYFSDGLTDTLIHVLAQVSGLKVTAKTSSFYFKGKNIDVGEIARELNVGTILEGSVQKSGNRIRVLAQLVNAGDGTHLWSKSFDRDLNDIFAVQDEIAQEVVMALKVTLLDTDEERLAQRYQPALQAYEQLILGQFEWGKLTADSLTAAEQHFKQAIALDPDYALAYVGLAETYAFQVTHGGLLLEESLQRRQLLIDKALELDALSGEVYIGRAYLRMQQQMTAPDKDYKGIEEDILKGLELSPSSAQAREWYSTQLTIEGRFEKALTQARMAADLDPMSPHINTWVAESTWYVGRAEEALVLIRRNVERTPEFPSNYSLMSHLQTHLGRLGEAQWWIQEARRRNPINPYYWMFECYGFMDLRDSQSAEDCVRQLSETHPDKIATVTAWASLYGYRGEWNKAIATLESLSARTPGFREHDLWLADVVAGQGDIERARRLVANAYPEFLEEGLELPLRPIYFAEASSHAAMVFAAILDANGETERRDVLLRAVEERIAAMHRTRGIAYGIVDVYVHAMRDDRDRAIAGLREALDMGWRGGTLLSLYRLGRDWKLADLHQDPEFIAMMNELETDIAQQRQWFEDHKDEPLF